MTKFAHLADCHLGSWRQEELQKLNFQSFQKIIDRCIQEQVEFILISGDLFDSAYPPIEILKDSFAEFKKLHDAKILVYLIAGSHDFSASGKTFLDVLEKAGFCKNVGNFEIQDDEKIKLIPHMHNNIAIYGYPGKKSGMEIKDLSKIYFDSNGFFTILMLHTAISDVIGILPIDSIEKQKLPLANYYAMGHMHQVFEVRESNSVYVYPGPTFPNNFKELIDLKHGSFQIVEIDNMNIKTRNIAIPLKEVVYIEVEIVNTLDITNNIIVKLKEFNLKNKIVLLRVITSMKYDKIKNINFNEISKFVKKQNCYTFLKKVLVDKVKDKRAEMLIPLDKAGDMDRKKIDIFLKDHPNKLNKYFYPLMDALLLERNEDERNVIYENRLMSEVKKILDINQML